LAFSSDKDEAVAVGLDVVIRELKPPAATFFAIDPEAQVRLHVTRGSGGPASLPRLPFGVDELGEARVVEADDHLTLAVRDGERVVACVSLWRDSTRPVWSPRDRRVAEALQPLVEMAYVWAVRSEAGLDDRLPESLTPRQRQVARMIASGATNIEVASALSISADTAKSHARAVLAKVGVGSRRELVMALTRSPSDDPATTPDSDDTARGLLSPVLDWATERIGALAGGCAVLSARFEPVAHAWATARGAAHLDGALVRRLQRQLFPGGGHSELVCRAMGKRPEAAIVEVESTDVVAELGVTAPLLAVLRTQGRVAGLTWLSRNPGAALDQRESAQALRGLHPLLELASAGPLTVAQTPLLTLDDLAARGLTPREFAVAQLAVEGAPNAEIASTLGISQGTVKHHMGQVLSKCGVRSRTQLIALLARYED
jgi:DNA-binding NarL/FixJ family response regulator